MIKILAKKILVMARADQRIRMSQFGRHRGKAKKYSEPEIKKLVIALRKVDEAHTNEMKKIISSYGWPTKSLVGKRASHAAWLLVQHSDHDSIFQNKCLKLIRDAAQKKDAEKKELAFLTDRVLVHKNKKQLYGTQFRGTKNGLRPFPISDLKNLDKRRKEMGLEPFSKYRKLFK